MAYNPWDTSPRTLDEETLKWLMSLGEQQGYGGVRDGYRYQGNPLNAGQQLGDANDTLKPVGPSTQWDRIAIDPQTGQDVGRDFEAYNPSGDYSHSWISGGQTLLDKVAPFIPAIAAMYMGMPAGMEGLLGGADAGAAELASAGITGGSGGAAAGAAELGGLEGLISSMGGSPFTLGLEGGALSMPALGSALPYAGALSGVSQLSGPPSSSSPSASVSLPSTIKDWLPLAGGLIAGATTDKEGEQTAKREPWEPAQPLLKDLIAQGQELAKRDPFSPYKKQVMEQQAGLLSGINTQALPGLLQSLQGLSTPYKRGGGRGTPTLSGLPTQFDPMQIFKRGG